MGYNSGQVSSSRILALTVNHNYIFNCDFFLTVSLKLYNEGRLDDVRSVSKNEKIAGFELDEAAQIRRKNPDIYIAILFF